MDDDKTKISIDGSIIIVPIVVLSLLLFFSNGRKADLQRTKMITDTISKCETEACANALEKIYLNETSGIHINIGTRIERKDIETK